MTKEPKPSERKSVDGNGLVPLPHALVATVRAAEGLKEALTCHPFPTLRKDLTTWKEAQALFDEVQAWAKELEKSYGNPWRKKERGDYGGLLERLGVGSPEFVSLETPPVKVDGADGCEEESRAHLGLWKLIRHPRSPRAVHSEDLLGPVPNQFCILPTTVVRDSLPADIRFQVAQRVIADRETFTAATGRRILKGLQQAEVLIRVQVLSLCAWVIEAIRKIEEAALPRITWSEDNAKGRVRVAVHLAGFTREVILAQGQFKLLKDLASHASVGVDRRRKADLMREIPELRPWVSMTGARCGLSAHGQGTFALHDSLRGRVGPRV